MQREPHIIISGLPGKMATLVTSTIITEINNHGGLVLQAQALTGEGQPKKASLGRTYDFYLVPPEKHEEVLRGISRNKAYRPTIVVDFSHPDSVNRNAGLYCNLGIPFVMGTTGGDRKALEKVVQDSGNVAVIAPNMALPIVALQNFMEGYSIRHSGQMRGYSLRVVESHQAGKKDTSGTAKAMIQYFNKLGIEFTPEQIEMIRDPARQRELGVPEEHLGGHGWHTYTISMPGKDIFLPLDDLRSELKRFMRGNLFAEWGTLSEHPSSEQVVSPDRSVVIRVHNDGNFSTSVTHNINGRQVYADGTLKAIKLLNKHLEEKGRVYSMIDVLKESTQTL